MAKAQHAFSRFRALYTAGFMIPFLGGTHIILFTTTQTLIDTATMPDKIYRSSYRKRKAYWTAFKVISSYLKLGFVSKFRGKTYYEKQLPAVNRRSAEQIKATILELQGLFVKFGQMISVMSNFLPDAFREPLESLQDKNQPRAYEEVAATIKEVLGKSPQELFSQFDKEPLASASIGQVHRARVGDQEVAVKIQHHNIDEIARADLSIIKKLVELHEWFFHIEGFEYMYDQVRQMIEEELDYIREAESMQRIKQNLQSVPELRVRIPKVYSEFTSRKTIVTEFCEGTNIAHRKEWLAWGHDDKDLAERFIHLYAKMILDDGYYHADPHPGNILINKAGEIILLDFGAVALLSDQMKAAIPALLEAVVKNDVDKMLDAMKQMGSLSQASDAEEVAIRFLKRMKEFIEKEVKIENLNIDAQLNPDSIIQLVSDLEISKMTRTFRVPKDWVLLNRAIMLVGGIVNQTAPTLNPVETVKPYLKEHLLGEKNNLGQFLIDTLKNQMVTAISLPHDLSKFLNQANQGKLQLEVQGLDRSVDRLYHLGQQILFAILFLSTLFYWSSLPDSISAAKYYFFGFLTCLFAFLFARAFWRGRV